jgi:phosphoribosylamine--glycine ligase
MNILLLGSGGREHALAWKLRQSPRLGQLLVAPGNAGTAAVAENVAISETDFEALADCCRTRGIDMLVVGPEVPLVAGVADYFAQHLPHIKVIGPKQAGAMLEGSKHFAKQFMLRHGIPTAAAGTFTAQTHADAQAFLRQQQPPYVLKADGLAAGKGVIIAATLAEADRALQDMLFDGKFGKAGASVVIEEYMHGIELSVFALTDGERYVLMPAAKDYKRVGEGDTGLNTGGMGAVSPVPFADQAFLAKVEAQVVKPTIEGLRQEGIDYVGFIYFGLMNVQGQPKVVEYNARLGDPETEVVLPRLTSDLVELFDLAAQRRLAEAQVSVDPRTATTVMLVSGGYPEDYEKGKPISGNADLPGQAVAFHAGTALKNGQAVTNGGRVIALTGLGNSLEEALAQSYAAAGRVSFEGMYYRKDIGFDLKG